MRWVQRCPYMVNEITLLNFIFFICILFVCVRSWSYVGLLLLVECLWVLLYCLFVLVAQYLNDLAFFMGAILILILAAVELVVGLLCFVLYYHSSNSVSAQPVNSK